MKTAPLRQRNFALLWFAGLISVTGDWMLRIALPIHVLAMTGSVAAISGVVTATILPVLLFGLVAGVYVDRWDRRKVMLVTSLAQGLVLLPLLAVESAGRLWIVYLVAFAGSTLSQFFASAENALLPNVVAAEQLPAANSLNALNNNLGRLIGPALGGIAAAALSLGEVALVDTVTFLAAAGLIALVKGRYRAEQERQGVLRELGGGIRTIVRSRLLIAIIVLLAITSVGEGVMGTLFVVFVTGPLRSGAEEMGWLMSAQAVGGILGGLFGARFAGRFNQVGVTAAASVLFGAIDVVIFNYPRIGTAVWPEILLFVMVGIPGVLSGAAIMTLLQTQIADAYLGRVFSAAIVVESVAQLAGVSIAAGFTDRFSVVNVLTVQGLGYVIAGAAFWLLRGWYRSDGAVPAADHDPDDVEDRTAMLATGQ